MSPSPFTRRKFLLTSAAATSSAWLLAACGGGGGEEAPPAQSSASSVPQADIDKAHGHRDDADVLDLGPRHQERGEALHHQVPEDQGRRGQRRPGRPALPEAPHGHPGRTGSTRRGSGGVPVHPVLHPRRGQPARPDALCPDHHQGQLRRLGVEPGQHQWWVVGYPAGHRADGPALSRGPAVRRGHRGTEDLRRLRRRRGRRTTPRIPRATWSTSLRTSRASSSPTCGRRACGRSASTARRRSRSTWPARRPRRS